MESLLTAIQQGNVLSSGKLFAEDTQWQNDLSETKTDGQTKKSQCLDVTSAKQNDNTHLV